MPIESLESSGRSICRLPAVFFLYAPCNLLFFLGRRLEMADRLVLYEVDEKVGVITLNRPEKLNAISAELQQQLTEAFTRADADPKTSVVLLRAEGRSFCAGYDISAKEPGKD